jgi:hypothetical protein
VSGQTTRRAFIGGGLAIAAGAGVAKLPDIITKQRRQLAFDTGRLSSAGPAPAFGTLKPSPASGAPLNGDLFHRGSDRRAGRLTITSIATDSGILRVHSLDLPDGTLVAIGDDRQQSHRISSGTRRYAGASGSVTVRSGAKATLALDVELEL